MRRRSASSASDNSAERRRSFCACSTASAVRLATRCSSVSFKFASWVTRSRTWYCRRRERNATCTERISVRVLIGRSSKVTVPAAAAAKSSNPARRDSPPLVRMMSGNSDQGGCASRTSKRSEPCAGSSASSVSTNAPALSQICREDSSNPWKICVSKPSALSKAAMASASCPTGAMIITRSSLWCIRDRRARLS